MFLGVRIKPIFNTMMLWGASFLGIASTPLVFVTSAFDPASRKASWIPIAGGFTAFASGAVVGFWLGFSREVRRIASEGSEVPQ